MPTIAQAQAKLGGRATAGLGMSKGVFVPKEDMPLALQMVADYVEAFERRTADELNRLDKVDTGGLASSIRFETTETANGIIIEVYNCTLFFCRLYAELIKGLEPYLTKELAKITTADKIAEVQTALRLITDGFTVPSK